MNRWLPAGLIILILLLQYPLWMGRGGWLRVWEMNRELASEYAQHREMAARNAALYAEVEDLKRGYEAIEERARTDLGMIRKDEVFFQISPPLPDSGARSDAKRELAR
jgi:cell division protein FtsB